MGSELKDILADLIFEDEPTIFDENSTLDFVESALHLMTDYISQNPTAITEPDFHEEMLEEVKEMLYIQFEHILTDWVEQDIDDILDDAFEIFITMFGIERSADTNTMQDTTNADTFAKKIAYLRSKPHPGPKVCIHKRVFHPL